MRSDQTIIGINSSTFSISKFSKLMRDSENFIGMHFANRIWSHSTLQSMPTAETSDDTVQQAKSILKKLTWFPLC